MSHTPLRILHVITSLRTGGAEKLMVDLLPRLQQQGMEVELALLDGTQTPFFDVLTAAGVRIHVLGNGMRAMHSPRCLPKLRKLMRHFDVVHAHNTPCQVFVALSSIGLRPRPQLITTEHNTTNRRRQHRWMRCFDGWMYGRYAHILCVSDAVRTTLQDYLPQLSRATTIANGIDVAHFANAAPAQDLLHHSRAQKLLVMAAAFRPQKDHETAICALHHLPEEYHLYLAGDGTRRAFIENFVAQEQLSARVHFLGNRSDVAAVLRAADVVVMSSHYEGLSLSSLEGLASGRPVVASDVAGLREIVGDAGLLFPEGDAHALAQCTRQLAQDDALRTQLIERGRTRAAAFDIGKMVAGYRDCYLSL